MRRRSDGRKAWAAVGLFWVAVIGVGVLAKALYPAELPPTANPDVIDNVFHNRAVVWAARLLLVSAAGVLALGGLFIVVSIAHRMKNREWLRRAGPFEITEGKLAKAETELDFWRQEALANEQEVIALRKLLESADQLTANLPDSR